MTVSMKNQRPWRCSNKGLGVGEEPHHFEPTTLIVHGGNAKFAARPMVWIGHRQHVPDRDAIPFDQALPERERVVADSEPGHTTASISGNIVERL